jgi:hypothetical protein
VLALAPACGGPAFRAAHSTLLGEPIGADAQPVAPGQLLGGEFLQVRAPNSPGWVLMRESSAQIQFGHPGASARETYVAMVSFFELPPTEGSEAFVALVRSARESDTSPERFAEVKESYEYTGARGYPCVRYVATSLDLKAPGGALPLAEHGLYCRHPKHEGTGFWALYSQRALKADADLAEQVRGFLEGVVVPDK